MAFHVINHLKKDEPKPYEHQPFPSVRYHRSGKTTLVNNEEESAALAKDEDWSETPATFNEPAEEAPKSTKKAK